VAAYVFCSREHAQRIAVLRKGLRSVLALLNVLFALQVCRSGLPCHNSLMRGFLLLQSQEPGAQKKLLSSVDGERIAQF